MGKEITVLLGTSYFGPIQYFTKFLLSPRRIIERFDHYTKQTYRNRCNIYGANGILSLSVPVQKGAEHKSYVRDVRIDYAKKWRKLHWKGIESAYRHSPFFEFYMDDIQAFLEKKHEFLLDLNLDVLEYLLEVLDIDTGYKLSQEFVEETALNVIDLRESIHPKRAWSEDPQFMPEPYQQVFADRMGFRANLSVIDLLFNEGPDARAVLEKSLRH